MLFCFVFQTIWDRDEWNYQRTVIYDTNKSYAKYLGQVELYHAWKHENHLDHLPEEVLAAFNGSIDGFETAIATVDRVIQLEGMVIKFFGGSCLKFELPRTILGFTES